MNRNRNTPYSWRNVEIVGGGFVTAVAFHPKRRDLLYARTDIGGAYRWDPKTRRWTPLQDWLEKKDWNLYGVESLGLDPDDPNRLLLAVGTYTNDWAGNGAILRSTDQGRSFQRADLPFKLGGNEPGRSIGERLAVKKNVALFGTRNEGLWRSDDGGARWRRVESFPVTGRTDGVGVGFVLFHASGIYACARARGQALWRSRDDGRTWEPLPGQPADLLPHHAAFDRDGVLYVTFGNGPGPNDVTAGAVWKWDSQSGAWTEISPVKPARFGYAGLAVDAARPGTVLVASMDRWNPGDDIWRTVDGGKTWRSYKPRALRDSSGAPFLDWGRPEAELGHWIGSVALDPFRPGHVLYVTGATIWGSDDAHLLDRDLPTHWSVRAQGLEETAILDLASPTDGAPLLSAMGDIGGFRHDELSTVPAKGRALSPLFNTTLSIDTAHLAPQLAVAAGNARIHGAQSLDGGASWKAFATEPPGVRGPGKIALSADGATILWAPQDTGAFVSRDHGASWTPCDGPSGALWVAADRVLPTLLWAWDTRSGTLWRSDDAGATWTSHATKVPGGGDSTLRTPFRSPRNVWLCAGDKGLWQHDASGTLRRHERVTNARDIGFGKPAEGRRYPAIYLNGAIGGAAGVFRSDDAGESWLAIDDAAHRFGTSGVICGDPRVFGRVYLGTNGRGIQVGEPR